jgi:putative membrane protein
VYRFFGPAGSGLFWVHDLVWLLIVVVIVIGTWLVIRAVLNRPAPPRPPYGAPPPRWTAANPALHELDLRYARGEIDRDEYLQRRADLSGQAAPPPPGTTPG